LIHKAEGFKGTDVFSHLLKLFVTMIGVKVDKDIFTCKPKKKKVGERSWKRMNLRGLPYLVGS
jgi:hypothetical protein